MIIGQTFVFVLAPKCASTSIDIALRRHGVWTQQRHEVLKGKPPHPIVAAVNRPWEDMLFSAWRYLGAKGNFEKWARMEQAAPEFVVYGAKDLREMAHHVWQRYVTHSLRWDHLHDDWTAFLDDAGLPQIDLQHANKSKMAG